MKKILSRILKSAVVGAMIFATVVNVKGVEPTDAEDKKTTEQKQSRAALPKDQWTGYINKMFPHWQGWSYDVKDPLQETNVNTSVINSKWTYYDAQPNGGIPSAKWDNKGGYNPSWFPAEAPYSARSKYSQFRREIADWLSFTANWSIKMKVKLPMKPGAYSNIFDMNYEMMDSTGYGLMEVYFKIGSNEGMHPGQSYVWAYTGQGQNVFVENQSKIFFPKDYFNTEREVELKNVYNANTDTYLCSINVGGKSITFDSRKMEATFPTLRNARIAGDFKMTGDLRWGKVSGQGGFDNPTLSNQYPVDSESYIAFDDPTLIYNNFNPKFDNIVWRDAKGNILDENSKVHVGDKLTVTTSLKNDMVTGDKISSMLLNDPTKTKGIVTDKTDNTFAKANRFTLNGTNSTPTQHVINAVVQPGTIGTNVTMGLHYADTFFRRDLYKDSKGPLVVRDVEQTEEIKVMELARDANGNIIKDGANFRFVEADDQNMLTQDSFIKVDGTFTNTRLSENINLKFKLDPSLAPGFDFTNIRNLTLTNGSGTATDLTNGTGLNFTIPMKGTSSYSFILPVKQTSVGKPFNTGDQKLKFSYDSSYTISGVETKESWNDEAIVSDSTRPIKDIDTELTTSDVTLKRGQAFDLLHETPPLLNFTGTNGASVDLDKIMFVNQGTIADWTKFGLDSASDIAGTVNELTADGTTMQSQVKYNQVIMLNGKKHYTRQGGSLEATPRTKTGTITLTVNGGAVVQPEAYFEIPDVVTLFDEGGIDDTHAGAKATIGIKDSITSTSLIFDVKADTDFSISDTKLNSYSVALYNADKTEMTKTGNMATVGTFTQINRKKVVWFNTKKDSKKSDGPYSGIMTFYITSR